MARLALRAFGLALAAPSARAGVPADQTGLFQIRSSTEAHFDIEASGSGHQEVLAEESGDKPKPIPGYNPEDYKEGLLVEVQLPSGKWVGGAIQRALPGDVWDVKVQGEPQQSVPARSLRKRLDEGESDWQVLDTATKRAGLKYRRSKNLTDVNGTGFVLTNSTVISKGEADGWVQTSHGYLPMMLVGEQVLAKRERKGTVAINEDLRDWYVEAEDARRRAAIAKKVGLKPLPPAQTYAENEEALFQTHDGAWNPARVVSVAGNNTYALLVRPAGGKEHMVKKANAIALRKAGPPKHEPVAGESPLCQSEGGCIEVQVSLEPSCRDVEPCTPGAELTVQTAMGKTIGELVESACKELSTYGCDTRLELRHHGRALPAWWRTFEAGLQDGATLSATLAPVTFTPIKLEE